MKKIIAVLALIALISGSVAVYADNDKPKFKSNEIFEQLKGWEKNFKIPEIEDIERGNTTKSFVVSSSGHVKITDAEVVSVSGSGFNAKVWGLTMRVETSSSTNFVVGKLRDWSLAEMKVGDRVDVMGIMREADGSVLASLVNAKVSAPRVQEQEVTRLRNIIQGLVAQLQEALRKMGRPLPPGISPVPTVSLSPSVSPVVSPSPSPVVTPTPSATVSPTPTASTT